MRHPPCEDVSWKSINCKIRHCFTVILLVRMWVENFCSARIRHRHSVILLVRMWVENLSWLTSAQERQVILLVRMWVENSSATVAQSVENVILLVRMWVENSGTYVTNVSGSSSSLWGCELKILPLSVFLLTHRHPPCEDVSWKVLDSIDWDMPTSHPPCEDVSWKDMLKIMKKAEKSSSLWGCELKKQRAQHWLCISKVILLVRMWVEKKRCLELNKV